MSTLHDWSIHIKGKLLMQEYMLVNHLCLWLKFAVKLYA